MPVIRARNVFVNDGGSSTHTSSSGSTHGGTGGSLPSGFTAFMNKYGTNSTNAYHQAQVKNANARAIETIANNSWNAVSQAHQAALAASNHASSVNNTSASVPVGNSTGTIPNDASTRTSSVGVSQGGQFGDYMDMLRAIQNENNAFNLQQTEMVNAFNAAEAQKQRDWQENLTRNAHQIEVADLQKAGLNPVLSALNGNGAAVPTGAAATGQKAVADDTTSRGVIGIINGLINATTATAVANIYANASMYGANVGAGATRYSADSHSSAMRYAANVGSVNNVVGNLIRALI